MNRVVVHIDRLVLRGFKDADPRALAAGLQQELTRLFADPRTLRQWTARHGAARLTAGPLAIGPGTGARAIGAEVARAIGAQAAPAISAEAAPAISEDVGR